MLTVAATLAGTAYTREAPAMVAFTCPDGERFSVQYLDDHVRVRTGSGIFALAVRESDDGETYSDGYTRFSMMGATALLERSDFELHDDCRATTPEI